MADRAIPSETWHDIVANVPIVPVDVIVRHEGSVLGKRTNVPGRGEWFVLGGRVRKNETLDAAIHRVAESEFGVVVRPESFRFTPDDQHADLRVFDTPFPDRHPYVEAYLRDAVLWE